MPDNILPLDDVLESFVTVLSELLATGNEGEVYIVGGSWEVAFDIEPEAFFFDVEPLSRETFDALDDYQRAVAFAVGFDIVETETEGPLFRLEYEHALGEEWEEEAVRELGLLALGLLRDVFGVRDIESLRVEVPEPE